SVGIPLALAQALEQGKRPKKVLLTGFGAGLAYGSILLDLSEFGK
ncbi:MAG: ketoacyl-ACP synthase III, partial [Ligilactobacillus sp.]|nr:ketoacyl-ACP synthase III [Ligilactobacillus sp.]